MSRRQPSAKLTISIRRNFLADFKAMFDAANGGRIGADILSISAFAAEILECAIIDFRAKKARLTEMLPLATTAPPPRIAPKPKLSRKDVQTIRMLIRTRELNQVSAARRFKVNQSTVSHLLHGNENGNG
jgi:hypothetical protein